VLRVLQLQSLLQRRPKQFGVTRLVLLNSAILLATKHDWVKCRFGCNIELQAGALFKVGYFFSIISHGALRACFTATFRKTSMFSAEKTLDEPTKAILYCA
jgi:hypothetical protein